MLGITPIVCNEESFSKFHAYSSHLITLSGDSSVKPVNRAKLCGYCSKWVNAKYIPGCAFLSDLLSPCTISSTVLQPNSLDILGAFTSLLRTIQELNKLSSKFPQHRHTYSARLKSITEEDSSKVFQQQPLQHFAEVKQHFSSHHEEYCTLVTNCLKNRLEWTDLEYIRDVIHFLTTKGWQKFVDEESQSVEASPGYEQQCTILQVALGHFPYIKLK